ncbi:hypothetical protein IEQ34_026516 [Dendrobium chrysotoxum]|uniref:Uncharacterized protein n=1 Tax=Dendrobium chrysotoxum TaxID=161865 RepID=A0AAV7FIL3_DENCH|nr:hypothetical protein IEQ34_026516 [Dendrobium chrysotoxum]
MNSLTQLEWHNSVVAYIKHLELGTVSSLSQNSASETVVGEIKEVDSNEAADLQGDAVSNVIAVET